MKLENKNILITGASSGIGKAIALRFAKEKAHLYLASRNLEKLNVVKKEVEKLGGTAEVFQLDVTKKDEIKSLFLNITKNKKILDIVIDNAGLGFIGNIYELTVDEIEQMLDVNTKGMIIVAKYALEVMTRQKHGHLFMTSSLAGLVTIPQWSVYVASKWAITGFSDCIRNEVKNFNVKVTTLHPGAVKTEFFDKDKANINIAKMGVAINPDDVAKEVFKAIFTDRKKIIMPASSQGYSSLYRLAPDFADFVANKISGAVKYHQKPKDEDEPEFSYVQEVSK